MQKEGDATPQEWNRRRFGAFTYAKEGDTNASRVRSTSFMACSTGKLDLFYVGIGRDSRRGTQLARGGAAFKSVDISPLFAAICASLPPAIRALLVLFPAAFDVFEAAFAEVCRHRQLGEIQGLALLPLLISCLVGLVYTFLRMVDALAVLPQEHALQVDAYQSVQYADFPVRALSHTRGKVLCVLPVIAEFAGGLRSLRVSIFLFLAETDTAVVAFVAFVTLVYVAGIPLAWASTMWPHRKRLARRRRSHAPHWFSRAGVKPSAWWYEIYSAVFRPVSTVVIVSCSSDPVTATVAAILFDSLALAVNAGP